MKKLFAIKVILEKIFLKNVIVIITLLSCIYSIPITESIAREIALNLGKERSEILSLSIDRIDSYLLKVNKIFYIVHFKPKGFALIASDNRVDPIIGFSFNNNFNIQDIPAQLDSLLSNYKFNFLDTINSNSQITPEVRDRWNYYLNIDIIDNEDYRDVEPLITANWNQGGSWNDMCPGNALVGCVAVAMGQVMYYWNNPIRGNGYHYYWHPEFEFIEADFGNTIYDFGGMLNNSGTPESQLLLFHAGVAVEMDYGYDGSGAFVCYTGLNAKTALQDHFNYDSDITCVSRNSYSESEWSNILINQLDNGWPIIYRAYYDGGGAGHAWNIDGYSGDLFHCNWGWGGSSNGYFAINSMNGFTEDQGAIINIIPDGLEVPVALFEYGVNNLVVSFTDLSELVNMVELESWFWDFGDGSFSTETSPVHNYSVDGVFQIILTVTNIYGIESEPYFEEISLSCIEDIDICGICGGDNQYIDCNGQCVEWSPICNDETYEGYIGSEACEGYIGLGSDSSFADNGGYDECGVCDGDNSTCTGCTDPLSDNFNPQNIIDDGSCTYVFNGPGYAIQFNGIDSYIDLGDNITGGVFESGSQSFTITAWIYPEQLTSDSSGHSIHNTFMSKTYNEVSSSLFLGEYYSNPGSGNAPSFGELVLTREDEIIDFSWGGGSPDPSIPNDDYQIRWTGNILTENSGDYEFRSYTDDGVRVFINEELVIDHWSDQGSTSRYGNITLDVGLHELVMEYYENGGGATAQLYWTPPGESETLVMPVAGSDNGNFEMGISTDGNLEVYIKEPCGDNLVILGDGELQIGEWHSIALTFDEGNVVSYIDENIYSQGTCGNSLDQSYGALFTFGGSLFSNVYYTGQLDEIRIWDYALTEETITTYLDIGVDPETEGLAAIWRFDEAEGDIVFDGTYGNNDGLLSGGALRQESTAPINFSFLIGDVNFDTLINVQDVIIIISFILGIDTPTSNEFNASDIDDNGMLNVLDIVQIVDIILWF